MTPAATPSVPLYVRHAVASDRGSWSMERDVAWDRIEPELALAQPELLSQLRDAALIESFHPVNLARLMRACWDDVDAGVCLSLEAYEVRHAQSASDLIAKRVEADPSIVPEILDAATRFRHYGSEVVGDVPVAMHGDEIAIRTFADRIERLCGTRLVDHPKSRL